jgi:hypothetical protein
VFLACINREEETTGARKVQRERYDGGDIKMISRWIIFLWCFCFGVKNLSLKIFKKRNSPLTAPPQKTTTYNYEGKRVQQGVVKHRDHRENENRKEQKKEKKKENHHNERF